MQTEYLWHGVKGYKHLDKFSYLFSMTTGKANERLRIIEFSNKHGYKAAIDAFGISKRTIQRWKASIANKDFTTLNPKSCRPKKLRESRHSKLLIDEIKRLRTLHPNIGKAKLHVMLIDWCNINNVKLPSESSIGRIIASAKDKMRLVPQRIDRLGSVKTIKRVFKDRKPKGLKTKPLTMWAVDTIQKQSCNLKRYLLTMIDPNSRVAFAAAIPSKHTKHTSKVLSALLDGLGDSNSNTIILSDNGSEFKKEFDELLKQKQLTHYWTYPRSPKMNAHNERFNRTIQEQFVDYNEDLLFSDIELFNEKLTEWLFDYNTKIPHHSLGLKTPIQNLMENHPECQRYWTNT
jgi:transposase InsO family protein